MFGRQSDIMNDKSKKKSIIMALAVFAALAVLSSPLLVNDNSDSSALPINDILLGEEEPSTPTEVSTWNDLSTALNNATVSGIKLTADIVAEAAINISRTLTIDLNDYTLSISSLDIKSDNPKDYRIFVNAGGALTITNSASNKTAAIEFTINNDNAKSAIRVLGSNGNEAALLINNISLTVLYDNGSAEEGYKPITTADWGYGIFASSYSNVTCNDATITAGVSTISTNGLNTGGATIEINGGEYTSLGAAAVYFPDGTSLTVSGGTFEGLTGFDIRGGSVSISDAVIKATGDKSAQFAASNGPSGWGMGIALFDHIEYGDNIVAEICDVTFDTEYCDLFVGQHPGSGSSGGVSFSDMSEMDSNDTIEITLKHNESTFFEYEIYPDGEIGTFAADISCTDKTVFLDKSTHFSTHFSGDYDNHYVCVAGTLAYLDEAGNYSSVSNIDYIYSVITGSLIIDGEFERADENAEAIIVSGDVTITGLLDLGNDPDAKIIVKPVVDENGNVIKSNVVFNIKITDEDGNSHYNYNDLPLEFVDENDEAVTDPKLVANVTKLMTDEAGQETIDSKAYTKDGVTVEVSDLTYNGGHQSPSVTVTQYHAYNNIKVLTKITFTDPNGDEVEYDANIYYAEGLDENGIKAKVEVITGTVYGFTQLEVTKAGTYTLLYTVSTNIIGDDGENTIDEDFEVTFKVHKKTISEVLPPIFKVYDGTEDAFGNLIALDIYDGDEVTFLLKFESPNAGSQRVFITGLSGNDADNYILSSLLDINNYNECDPECEVCNNLEYNGSNCTCDKPCLANWELLGYIFQKTITEDMIKVTNIAPTFDNPDTVFPIIAVTIGDETYELDTSKISNRGYLVPFEGFFINSNGDKYVFDEGIPTDEAGSYYVFINNLNYTNFPELMNYTAGPLVGLANSDESEISRSTIAYFENLAIGDIDIDIDYQDIINWFITIPINGEGSGNAPITDMVDKTLILLYYLAYAEEGAEINGELFISENDDWTHLHSESLNNSVGIRAWYFSFLDQLADKELVDGEYQIVISSNNVEIAIFEFSISYDDQLGKNLIFGEEVDLNYVQAWASKQSFEAKSGMVIKYHYIYSDGSERHFEQIIRPELSNLGVPYYYSNVGANSGLYSFLNWTTLGDANLYPDVVENEEFFVNSLQSIDSSDLKEYAIEGVLNLYAVYDSAGEPVRPEGGYAKKVATFYDIDAKTVQDMMNLYSVQVSDVANRTFALIYEQYGCSGLDVKGDLYKLVNGELLKVFSEPSLIEDNGRRAWYFSFDDQASIVVDKYGLAGYYDARIVAVDSEGNETELLSTKFHIAEELYGVNITVDYVNADGEDGVKVYVEPKKGCLVPAGELIIAYSYMSSGPFGDEPMSAIVDAVPISASSSTQIFDIDVSGMNSANAIFKWVDSNGSIVYSLSNTVTSQ